MNLGLTDLIEICHELLTDKRPLNWSPLLQEKWVHNIIIYLEIIVNTEDKKKTRKRGYTF